MFFRILIITFSLYLLFRLIKIVANTVKAFKAGSLSGQKTKGEVGRGWIVDEEDDDKID